MNMYHCNENSSLFSKFHLCDETHNCEDDLSFDENILKIKINYGDENASW